MAGPIETEETEKAAERAASEPIGGDFDPVGLERWTEKAEPGDPTPIEPDLAVRWLYTSDDALAPDPAGAPHRAPFVRGGRGPGPWEIRQSHAVPVRAEANAAILEDLEGGVAAVGLRLDAAARGGHAPGSDGFASGRGRDGIMVSTLDDLDEVLDGVMLDLAPIALDAGAAAPAAAALLSALWQRREITPADALGSFRFDPIGTIAAEGISLGSHAETVAGAGALAAQTAAEYPRVRALAVDTSAYVGAGALPSTELAVAAATGLAYLRACEDAGLPPAEAAERIEFSLTVGPDQFGEIAKLRAWRRIWARILEASGVEPDARRSPLHVRTSRRMLSAIDPWVNMLRGTTAVFAGAVAGADGITVDPFDAEIGLPGPLGRRMSRNTQLVLLEESSLAKVADPGGGSWYVESLSDELAQLGWRRFTEIESNGGILAALEGGEIAEQLAEAAGQRYDDLARRRREMTGVNNFPLLGDDGTEPVAPPDPEALAREEAERLEGLGVGGDARTSDLAELRSLALEGARIDELAAASGREPETTIPLAQRRDSAPFEALRNSSEGRADDGQDAEPARIYLAAVGPLARHNSVATWAKNFFESGGIAAEASGEHPDASSLAAAFAESGLRAAAVCAHRDEEADALASAVAALRDAGAERIVLAMRSQDDAEAASADLAVRDGIEMIETLSELAESCRGTRDGR